MDAVDGVTLTFTSPGGGGFVLEDEAPLLQPPRSKARKNEKKAIRRMTHFWVQDSEGQLDEGTENGQPQGKPATE